MSSAAATHGAPAHAGRSGGPIGSSSSAPTQRHALRPHHPAQATCRFARPTPNTPAARTLLASNIRALPQRAEVCQAPPSPSPSPELTILSAGPDVTEATTRSGSTSGDAGDGTSTSTSIGTSASTSKSNGAPNGTSNGTSTSTSIATSASTSASNIGPHSTSNGTSNGTSTSTSTSTSTTTLDSAGTVPGAVIRDGLHQGSTRPGTGRKEREKKRLFPEAEPMSSGRAASQGASLAKGGPLGGDGDVSAASTKASAGGSDTMPDIKAAETWQQLRAAVAPHWRDDDPCCSNGSNGSNGSSRNGASSSRGRGSSGQPSGHGMGSVAFNHVHCSAALSQLARLAVAKQSNDDGSVGHVHTSMSPQSNGTRCTPTDSAADLVTAVTEAEATMGTESGQHGSRGDTASASGSGRASGRHDGPLSLALFAAELCGQAERLLPMCRARQLSNMAWAVAKLYTAPAQAGTYLLAGREAAVALRLFRSLLQRCDSPAVWQSVAPQEASSLIYAVALLQQRWDKEQAQRGVEAAGRAPAQVQGRGAARRRDGDPPGAAHVVTAQWLSRWMAASLRLLPQMGPQAISNSAWGLAVIMGTEAEAEWAELSLIQGSSGEGRNGNSSGSGSSGEGRNGSSTGSSSTGSSSTGSSSGSSNSAALLAGVGRAAVHGWLRAACDASAAHLRGYPTASLALLAWACAKLQFTPGQPWLGAFLSASYAHLPRMPAQDLANVGWAATCWQMWAGRAAYRAQAAQATSAAVCAQAASAAPSSANVTQSVGVFSPANGATGACGTAATAHADSSSSSGRSGASSSSGRGASRVASSSSGGASSSSGGSSSSSGGGSRGSSAAGSGKAEGVASPQLQAARTTAAAEAAVPPKQAVAAAPVSRAAGATTTQAVAVTAVTALTAAAPAAGAAAARTAQSVTAAGAAATRTARSVTAAGAAAARTARSVTAAPGGGPASWEEDVLGTDYLLHWLDTPLLGPAGTSRSAAPPLTLLRAAPVSPLVALPPTPAHASFSPPSSPPSTFSSSASSTPSSQPSQLPSGTETPLSPTAISHLVGSQNANSTSHASSSNPSATPTPSTSLPIPSQWQHLLLETFEQRLLASSHLHGGVGARNGMQSAWRSGERQGSNGGSSGRASSGSSISGSRGGSRGGSSSSGVHSAGVSTTNPWTPPSQPGLGPRPHSAWQLQPQSVAVLCWCLHRLRLQPAPWTSELLIQAAVRSSGGGGSSSGAAEAAAAVRGRGGCGSSSGAAEAAAAIRGRGGGGSSPPALSPVPRARGDGRSSSQGMGDATVGGQVGHSNSNTGTVAATAMLSSTSIGASNSTINGSCNDSSSGSSGNGRGSSSSGSSGRGSSSSAAVAHQHSLIEQPLSLSHLRLTSTAHTDATCMPLSTLAIPPSRLEEPGPSASRSTHHELQQRQRQQQQQQQQRQARPTGPPLVPLDARALTSVTVLLSHLPSQAQPTNHGDLRGLVWAAAGPSAQQRTDLWQRRQQQGRRLQGQEQQEQQRGQQQGQQQERRLQGQEQQGQQRGQQQRQQQEAALPDDDLVRLANHGQAVVAATATTTTAVLTPARPKAGSSGTDDDHAEYTRAMCALRLLWALAAASRTRSPSSSSSSSTASSSNQRHRPVTPPASARSSSPSCSSSLSRSPRKQRLGEAADPVLKGAGAGAAAPSSCTARKLWRAASSPAVLQRLNSNELCRLLVAAARLGFRPTAGRLAAVLGALRERVEAQKARERQTCAAAAEVPAAQHNVAACDSGIGSSGGDSATSASSMAVAAAALPPVARARVARAVATLLGLAAVRSFSPPRSRTQSTSSLRTFSHASSSASSSSSSSTCAYITSTAPLSSSVASAKRKAGRAARTPATPATGATASLACATAEAVLLLQALLGLASPTRLSSSSPLTSARPAAGAAQLSAVAAVTTALAEMAVRDPTSAGAGSAVSTGHTGGMQMPHEYGSIGVVCMLWAAAYVASLHKSTNGPLAAGSRGFLVRPPVLRRGRAALHTQRMHHAPAAAAPAAAGMMRAEAKVPAGERSATAPMAVEEVALRAGAGRSPPSTSPSSLLPTPSSSPPTRSLPAATLTPSSPPTRSVPAATAACHRLLSGRWSRPWLRLLLPTLPGLSGRQLTMALWASLRLCKCRKLPPALAAAFVARTYALLPSPSLTAHQLSIALHLLSKCRGLHLPPSFLDAAESAWELKAATARRQSARLFRAAMGRLRARSARQEQGQVQGSSRSPRAKGKGKAEEARQG